MTQERTFVPVKAVHISGLDTERVWSKGDVINAFRLAHFSNTRHASFCTLFAQAAGFSVTVTLAKSEK